MSTVSGTSGRRLVLGVASGAVGTLAMDLLLFTRYRRGGGNKSFLKWEFAATVADWDEVSDPGQVGEKLEKIFLRRPLPGTWARPTTILVHWATGASWGIPHSLLASKVSRGQWILVLSLGPIAWLSSYAILPLAKVYKPIWDYDVRTLGKDLSAHVVYGVVAGTTFAALSGALAPRDEQ